jgi:uncharacterized integral membrane protein
MSDLHGTSAQIVDPQTETTPKSARSTRSRTGRLWFGVCTGATLSIVLIIFMLQNTRSVAVTFLWMHGNVPLALALLIAAVGTGICVLVIGSARIVQLRRRIRRG